MKLRKYQKVVSQGETARGNVGEVLRGHAMYMSSRTPPLKGVTGFTEHVKLHSDFYAENR
jgi:hypothetical protein